MKKLLIWLPGMLSMLAACTEAVEIPARAPEKQSPVRVELHLTTEQQAATRAMDENCIRDVNLYLYGDTEYHFYFPSVSSPLVFNVLPGNYQSYAIANAGQDLGDKNAFKIQFYETAVDVMESSDAIPMTDRGTLAVDGAGRCTPSSLRVTRSAAKIAYTIEVADAVAPSLSLRSVQFCNLPRTIRPFDSGSISSTVEANYYDGEAMPVGNERRTAGTAYLFENLQGSVDTITDQKDKCPENAPSCATYLRILAERSTDKALVEYIVYPGENNTSDFNVRRNTWHNLELVIMGENEIDNRVLVYDGLYYGTANCHICTGDQVTFDITPYRTSRSRNYAYLGIEAAMNTLRHPPGCCGRTTRSLQDSRLRTTVLRCARTVSGAMRSSRCTMPAGRFSGAGIYGACPTIGRRTTGIRTERANSSLSWIGIWEPSVRI